MRRHWIIITRKQNAFTWCLETLTQHWRRGQKKITPLEIKTRLDATVEGSLVTYRRLPPQVSVGESGASCRGTRFYLRKTDYYKRSIFWIGNRPTVSTYAYLSIVFSSPAVYAETSTRMRIGSTVFAARSASAHKYDLHSVYLRGFAFYSELQMCSLTSW